MPNLLPTIFIVLGASALVLTLYWLWQSLRLVLVHVDPLTRQAPLAGSEERVSLLQEKSSLLVALKDLEAERESGKLSEGDFVELNLRYRARAREVLRALDTQIAPHRDAARALLRSATHPETAEPSVAPAAIEPTRAPASDSSIPAVVSSVAGADALRPDVCVACGARNDADAAFCKKCGMRLRAEPEA